MRIALKVIYSIACSLIYLLTYCGGSECAGNRKALVEKSGLVKHAAGSSKLKDVQSRQALSAEQQQRNTAHRYVCLALESG